MGCDNSKKNMFQCELSHNAVLKKFLLEENFLKNIFNFKLFLINSLIYSFLDDLRM